MKKTDWRYRVIILGIIIGVVLWGWYFAEYQLSFTNMIYNTEPFNSLKIKTKGPLLSDPLDQMMTEFYRLCLSGKPFSIWDSYNAMGRESTSWDILMSPFNWFYILGLGKGQFLKYIFKYLCAFWGMFLFLKNKRLDILSCAAGGITFCCSSAIVHWGGWPHSDVIALAPWAFWAAANSVSKFYNGNIYRCFFWQFIFSGVLYLMLVAGMPTYAAYFLYMGIIYVIWLCINYNSTFLQIVKCLCIFLLFTGLAGIMSFGYCGGLLLKTQDYQETRGYYAYMALGIEYIRTLILPYFRNGLEAHINESTLFSGFLWILGIPFCVKIGKNKKEFKFWLIATIIILLFIFSEKTGIFYQMLPMINSSVKYRIIVLLNFTLSIVGGFVFDFLLKNEFEENKCWSVIFYVGLFLGLSIWAINQVPSDIEKSKLEQTVIFYLLVLVLTGVGGTFCIMNWKKCGACIMFMSTVCIGAIYLREYMPLIDKNADIVPKVEMSPSLEYLKEHANETNRITGTGWFLRPNLNQYYDLRDIRIHGFKATEQKFKNYIEAIDENAYVTPTYIAFSDLNEVNTNLLSYASIQFVASSLKGSYERTVGAIDKAPQKISAIEDVVEQEFVANENNLSSIEFVVSTYKKKIESEGFLEVGVWDANKEIVSKHLRLSDLEDNQLRSISFEPIPQSKGRAYIIRLSLSCDLADPIALWFSNEDYLYGDTQVGDIDREGDLCISMGYGENGVKFDDNVQIMKLQSYCPRAYMVDKIQEEINDENILSKMKKNLYTDRVFINSDQNIIFNADSLGYGLQSEVRWKRDDGEKIELTTDSNKEAILVMTENYDDGWKAYIDGVETKIYNVNYLFNGIVVPEGKHDIQFCYSSKLLYIDMLISVVGYLIYTGGAVGLLWRGLNKNAIHKKEI